MRRLAMLAALAALAGVCADRELAGRYAGEWKSGATGIVGAYRMTLALSRADRTWNCDASFVYEGSEVKTRLHEIALKDSKIDVSYDFAIQGADLRTRMTGEWNGNAFIGKYETSVLGGDGVDYGTWSAARVK
jgi:hypothetical protein